jgi:hypothetical protein
MVVVLIVVMSMTVIVVSIAVIAVIAVSIVLVLISIVPVIAPLVVRFVLRGSYEVHRPITSIVLSAIPAPIPRMPRRHV